MKKVLSLLLAAALLLSMAVVASADDVAPLEVLTDPFVYDDETNDIDIIASITAIEPGDTVIFLLFDPYSGFVDDPIYVNSLKAKFVPEMGGELIEETGVRKFCIETFGGYHYALYLKLKEDILTAEADIGGHWELDRKANNRKGVKAVKDLEVEIDGFSLNYERSYRALLGELFYTIDGIFTDSVCIGNNEGHLLKFDYDDEITFEFGSESASVSSMLDGGSNNEGEFEVDVSGQGKLYIEFNTAPNEYICALNEGADMRFVNFIGSGDADKLDLEPQSGIYSGIKFNRTGTYTYEYEDITPESEPMAYIVTACTAEDGTEKAKLTPINGCEYDGSEFTFDTNRLVSYVFADRALIA